MKKPKFYQPGELETDGVEITVAVIFENKYIDYQYHHYDKYSKGYSGWLGLTIKGEGGGIDDDFYYSDEGGLKHHIKDLVGLEKSLKEKSAIVHLALENLRGVYKELEDNR